MVTFQLHKKGVILIVILSLIVAVLLVAAGFLWGRSSVEPAATGRRPAAAAQTVPANSTTTAEGGRLYTLRVGIEATEEEAQSVVKALAARKLAVTVAPVETSSGAVIYELHTGSYADRSAAARAAAELEDDFQLSAAVVPVP